MEITNDTAEYAFQLGYSDRMTGHDPAPCLQNRKQYMKGYCAASKELTTIPDGFFADKGNN